MESAVGAKGGRKHKQGGLGFKIKKKIAFISQSSRRHVPSKGPHSVREELSAETTRKNPTEKTASLGVPTPEKSVSTAPRGFKNKGKGIKTKNPNYMHKASSDNEDDIHKVNDSQHQDSELILAKSPKAADFKLPDKYALLGEFFDCMEASIRLLKLRKQMCTFTNICPRVEQMTKRRFTHTHLAQIKYVLNEAVELERILIHDESSACMKRDLRVTLRSDTLQSDKESLTRPNSTAILRQTFHTRLREFAETHAEGEDVPEAALPEPFNKKTFPESFSVSVKKNLVNSFTSPAKANPGVPSVEPEHPSIPSVEPNAILQQISSQRDPQPLPIVSSHLPQTFKRHFSQRPHPIELSLKVSSFTASAKPAYSSGVTVLPSSVLDQIIKGNDLATFQQPKDEEKNSEFFQETSDLEELADSEYHFSSEVLPSVETPIKILSPGHKDSEDACFGTTCRTPVQPQISSSTPSTPFHTCAGGKVFKDCFSPSTPCPDSTEFGTPASCLSYPLESSSLKVSMKSHPSRSIKERKQQYLSASPLALGPSASFASPDTHVFSTPNTDVDLSPVVHHFKDSHVMTPLAFESSGKQSHCCLPIVESPVFSSPLKRKAMLSNFDDLSSDAFQSVLSSIPSTPDVNGEVLNYLIDPSPLSTRANLFITPKKDKKVARALPFKSPTKLLSSQKTQEESNLEEKESGIPHLQTPKRSRLCGNESTTSELKTVECSTHTQVLSLRSPSDKDLIVAKLDLESFSKDSDHVQQQDKAESSKVEVAYKVIDATSQSNQEIVRCSPSSLVQLVKENKKTALEQSKVGLTAAKRRQQMIACLPKLFNMIHSIFSSYRRPVMTQQELVYKILASHFGITERAGEVEEQLQLLEELVPDWISKGKASSGDLLYRIQKTPDLQGILTRLVGAM